MHHSFYASMQLLQQPQVLLKKGWKVLAVLLLGLMVALVVFLVMVVVKIKPYVFKTQRPTSQIAGEHCALWPLRYLAKSRCASSLESRPLY